MMYQEPLTGRPTVKPGPRQTGATLSIPNAALAALTRSPDEGEALWVTGGLYTYKTVWGENGAYLACEVQAPAGMSIPVHYHEDEEEGFYVARGAVTIFLGDAEHALKERTLEAGGFALAPRGVRHSFRLETPDAALLLLVSPGRKHEALFRDLGEPAAARVLPPPGEPPDAQLLAEIAARHGTFIVGPPPR